MHSPSSSQQGSPLSPTAAGPPSSPQHRNIQQQQHAPQQHLHTAFGFGIVLCLIITSLSCMATAYAVKSLAEWPPETSFGYTKKKTSSLLTEDKTRKEATTAQLLKGASVAEDIVDQAVERFQQKRKVQHQHQHSDDEMLEERFPFSLLHYSMIVGSGGGSGILSESEVQKTCGGTVEDQVDALVGPSDGLKSVASQVQRRAHEVSIVLERATKAFFTSPTSSDDNNNNNNKKSNKANHPVEHKNDNTDDDDASSSIFPRWSPPPFAVRAAKKSEFQNNAHFYDRKHQQQRQQQNAEQNIGMTDTAAIAQVFQQVLLHSRQLSQKSSDDLPFARNTVDKLIYQLDNFEPLVHVEVAPQWNPLFVEKGRSGSGVNDASSSSSCREKNIHKKKFIIGMSSVSRSTNYLFKTVSSIVTALSDSELSQISLVILDGDVPPGKNPDINSIKASFGKFLKDGTIRIIVREQPHLPHPQMRRGVSELTQRWGDAPSRIAWRSKQVLDVAFLMNYAATHSRALLLSNEELKLQQGQDDGGASSQKEDDLSQRQLPTNPPPAALFRKRKRGNNDGDDNNNNNDNGDDQQQQQQQQQQCPDLGGYFLMMEDDIIASKHFVTKIKDWMTSDIVFLDTTWTVCSFYNPWPVSDHERMPPYKFFGVIGQLFRLHDLPSMVEFLQKNFDQSPLDWLFVDFLKKMGGSMIVHTPSMFQHKGVVSSLEGKEQDGRAVDFQP